MLVVSTGCSVGESMVYSCQWPMWGQNPSRTFSYDGSCPTGISPETVGDLEERWHFETKDVVSATPAVADGTAYVGDWLGYFYALDLQTGEPRWTFKDAKIQPNAALGQLTSSAAVADIDGGRMVFFGSGKHFYALKASDGELRWEHELGSKDFDDPTEIESSPVVAEGLVIFGTDVFGNSGGYRAGLYALDAGTGEERWRFDPEEGLPARGCGDVWSSPAVNLSRRTVYVGTANCFEEEGFGRYAEAIVALNLDTGEPLWSYQPHRFNQDDLDFAGAPNLMEAGGRQLIGLGNKDGAYYALTPEGKLAWKQKAAEPDPGRGNTGGFVGPTGYARGAIFGGTGRKNAPFLHAIDAETGEILWQREDTAPIFGAPAEVGGVLFIGDARGTLHAVELASGETLWEKKAAAPITGGVAIVGSEVITVEGLRGARGVREPKEGSKARGVTLYTLP